MNSRHTAQYFTYQTHYLVFGDISTNDLNTKYIFSSLSMEKIKYNTYVA